MLPDGEQASSPLDACSWYEEDQVRHSRGDCEMEGRKKKVSKEFRTSEITSFTVARLNTAQ